MILHPCLTCCYKGQCAKEHSLKKKLKGSGILTCSFSCKKKWKNFQPGTRVSATFDVFDWGIADTIEINGTIMRRSNRSTHKLLVWLDEPVRNDIVRVNLFQNRLTLLDEPILKVCPECYCPENKENNDGWYCETCNPELKNTDLFDAPGHQVARYKRKKNRYKIEKRLERVVGLDILAKITGKVISEGR